ncbi:hypothetical protein AB0I53_28205 [Saccharopolyspora sp. NPDC050389]|uniref:hypothetical protein n=1 Tax=Saccharopolyspora sp. NPDC050389 TaxID=3155516 RepID=UPI0033F56D95
MVPKKTGRSRDEMRHLDGNRRAPRPPSRGHADSPMPFASGASENLRLKAADITATGRTR